MGAEKCAQSVITDLRDLLGSASQFSALCSAHLAHTYIRLGRDSQCKIPEHHAAIFEISSNILVFECKRN